MRELENPMVIGDYYETCDRCGATLSSWYHSTIKNGSRRYLCDGCQEEEENNEREDETAEGWHHPHRR